MTFTCILETLITFIAGCHKEDRPVAAEMLSWMGCVTGSIVACVHVGRCWYKERTLLHGYAVCCVHFSLCSADRKTGLLGCTGIS